jgi:capsular exopolysaccharide synthesis family protein
MRSLLKRRRQRERRRGDLSESLITVLDPAGAASEAYRVLRTGLLYTLVDTPPKVVMLTSPNHSEGKSTTCANLGVVLATAGKNTLIIDCDLRKPKMHEIFQLRNLYGVVDLLLGEQDLSEVSQDALLPGLGIVTAGPQPPNPAELLGSRRFTELIGRARQAFDYVLIDTPPTELVSDPAILATQGDGVLLVLDAQNTRKSSVRRCIRSLEAVGANILGTVMNNAEVSKDSYYGYGYAY